MVEKIRLKEVIYIVHLEQETETVSNQVNFISKSVVFLPYNGVLRDQGELNI